MSSQFSSPRVEPTHAARERRARRSSSDAKRSGAIASTSSSPRTHLIGTFPNLEGAAHVSGWICARASAARSFVTSSLDRRMSGTERDAKPREETTDEVSPTDTPVLSASASASGFASVDEELEFTAPKPRNLGSQSHGKGNYCGGGIGTLVRGWSLLCCCQGPGRTKNADRC